MSSLGVDHVIPLAECATHVPPIDPYDPRNLAAVHHQVPCPTCSAAAGQAIRCNILKSNLSLAAGRQKISNRTGLEMPGGIKPDAGKRPRKAAKPEIGERPW